MKKEFEAFRAQCIWLRNCYNTYADLYESDTNTKELLRKAAGIFFHDLNRILIEYCWLQICKITDPPESHGRDNLTIKYFDEKVKTLSLGDQTLEEIDKLSKEIHRYRTILNQGRNRVVTHLDKETIVSGKTIGEHSAQDLQDFLKNLNQYTDAVGRAIGSGPLDYMTTPGVGDVQDLVTALREHFGDTDDSMV